MAIDRGLLTAEQFAALPDMWPHVELYEGVVTQMAPASPRHGEVIMRLALVLGVYLQAHPIGRLTGGDAGVVVQRDPDSVLGPDVALVLHTQRTETGPLPLRITDMVPAFVVEVRSPSDRGGEIAVKTRRWLAAGCQLVWNVDPVAATVDAHGADGTTRHFNPEDVLDAQPLLPGFSIAVSELFA